MGNGCIGAMLWECCSGDGGRVCGVGNGATPGVCDFKGGDEGRKEDGECIGAIVGDFFRAGDGGWVCDDLGVGATLGVFGFGFGDGGRTEDGVPIGAINVWWVCDGAGAVAIL